MLDVIVLVAAVSTMTIALNRANDVRVPFPHNIYISLAVGIATYMVLYSIVSAIFQMAMALLSSWAGVLLMALIFIGVATGVFMLIQRWRQDSDPFGPF